MDDGSSCFDFDVCVIGAGVAGCCAARELVRYDLRVCVLEADNDVAGGISRANSGIVHAGFDPRPGTLKARFNVEGSRLFPIWAKELGFMFRRNGSMVLAFDDEEVETVNGLAARAELNGAHGVHIVSGETAREMEPNVSQDVVAALVAPTGGICDPYGLALAVAENAAQNGVRFFFNSRADCIESTQDGWLVTAKVLGRRSGSAAGRISDGGGFPGPFGSDAGGIADTQAMRVSARAVVNAAGLYSDVVNNMVSARHLQITPRKGEYYILDTQYGSMFDHTMFQAPSSKGKGVLVTPTIHGNLLLGPNAEVQESKTDFSTTREGLDEVLERARRTWPEASQRGAITSFAGLRSTGDAGDFVIGEAPDAPGFFNIACFDSPGLTSAPAVGEYIAGEVARKLDAGKNADFDPRRQGRKRFSLMTDAERAEAIARDPGEGHVVCRCCTVNEAEVVEALHSPLQVDSLDAVKWRTSATMGRCHGGFCTPEIVRIISRELGLRPEQMDKRHAGSWMFSSARDDFAELAVEEGAEDAADETYARVEASSDAMAGAVSDVEVMNVEMDGAGAGIAASNVVSGIDGPGAISPEDVVSEIYADVVVVGGGAAGLAAASSAKKSGAREVVLLDRETAPGGVLRQCVHNGFGLHRMGEELTGPEFAAREVEDVSAEGCTTIYEVAVLRIDDGLTNLENPPAQEDGVRCAGSEDGGDAVETSPDSAGRKTDSPVRVAGGSGMKTVVAVRRGQMLYIHAKAIVLSTGSRERGFGALDIAGTRPAGIYTAGCAQTLMNLQGCLPGQRAVVLGSGDIGLIMARRMTLSGMEVLGVYEMQPYSAGLRRNIVQCLDDFGIPLHLSRTVVRVEGDSRLEAVLVADVDPETLKPIPGTEERVECDTLVLSCGLIPENEIAKTAGVELSSATKGPVVDESLQTSVPGIFACGNSLHVHDLADFAAEEGERAGRAAAEHAMGEACSEAGAKGNAAAAVFEGAHAGSDDEDGEAVPAAPDAYIEVVAGENVRYVVPQKIRVAAVETASGEASAERGPANREPGAAGVETSVERMPANREPGAVGVETSVERMPDACCAVESVDDGPDEASDGASDQPGGIVLSFRVSDVVEAPVLLVIGVDASGEPTVVSSTRAKVAVPAEMRRVQIEPQRLAGYAKILVSAVPTPKSEGDARA